MKDTVVRTSSIFLTTRGLGCDDDKALQATGTLFIRGKRHPMNSWKDEVACPVLRDRHPSVNEEYYKS